MKNQGHQPAELRAMFGANLRKLSAPFDSISDLSRQLGINRTQFNRYLAGESFPRPDVLARICHFFSVDARVLLEPVRDIGGGVDPIANPFLREYLGSGAADVPEDVFPSGFYRFSRRSFINHERFLVGLLHVRREGPNTFLRGFESRQATQAQGLPQERSVREFRGIVMQQEDGIALLAARQNAMTCSFNYLSRVASFQNNYWVGYVTRTVPETIGNLRATRLAYEYLGSQMSRVLPAARSTGFRNLDDLPLFHQRLLQPDQPFT